MSFLPRRKRKRRREVPMFLPENSAGERVTYLNNHHIPTDYLQCGVDNVNKSEKIAFDWLVKNENITPSKIIFRRNRTPDFLLPNGKGIEVKKLYKDCIIFNSTQLNHLQDENIILIIKEGEKEPIQVQWKEIKGKEQWDNIRIIVNDLKIVGVTKKTWFKIMQTKLQYGFSSVDGLISYMFKKTFKKEGKKHEKNKGKR